MNEQKLKLNADKAKEALESARAELAIIQDKVRKLYNTYERAYDKYVNHKLSSCTDNIALVLDGSNNSKSAYAEYLKMLNEYKMYSSGEWVLTGQRCVGVMFTKNPKNPSDNELQIQGLKKFKPYIIPLKIDEYVGKPFNIFEHTLSSDGSYTGMILDDDSIVVSLNRYGRMTHKHFDTFDKGMEYIIRKHWYRDDDSDEYD